VVGDRGTAGPGGPLSERIAAEARRILEEGRWSTEDTARLDEEFERAAKAALRAPVLAERSLVLRRVGKAVVPARWRPAARRAVGHLDAMSRSLFAARRTPR